ncbi:hypothetical protein FVF58_09580 [Paraburkholderia panacisoli]|uniref:Uncharacterized protein n=1 Tax=Paraburkholderia panacisoli TaxID=2603818 RepID=A0A5B0HD00_9BURK|nr:hypothetical protein [Paraburkholderia panacisoli]KAA1013031.1 hypothetical protein FVF58_09580 [Paraburkholderia panacisoli]
MARKTKTLVIETAGRDAGKMFHITELSASEAEAWATRALFVMMNCGVEVPDDLMSAGLAGIAAIGIKSLSRVPYEMAKPLFDEMMACIAVVPDPKQPLVKRGYGGVGPMIEDDIEEVSTRLQLRKAVLELHLDFFFSPPDQN